MKLLQLLFDWRSYTVLDWFLAACLIVVLISIIGGVIAYYFTEYH